MAKLKILNSFLLFSDLVMNKNFDSESENKAQENLICQIQPTWKKEDPDSFKFSPVRNSLDATSRTCDFVESMGESSTGTSSSSNEESLCSRGKTSVPIISQELKISASFPRRKYGDKETSLKNIIKDSLATYEKSDPTLEALLNFIVKS